MNELIIPIATGLLGGFVRAFVGLMNYYKTEKKPVFKPWYLVSSLLTAGVVGAVAGLLSGNDWRAAGAAGYAGTDFLEGLYRLKLK